MTTNNAPIVFELKNDLSLNYQTCLNLLLKLASIKLNV